MSETVLVTGGAGFIGSHLVDALVAGGYKVRVIDCLEPQVHGDLRIDGRWPDYCNPEAEFILGDVRDRHILKHALDGVEVIFHQAAAVGVGQSQYDIERYVDINIRGTAVLLDLLANEPVISAQLRKVIVASSMSIYGEGSYACPVHGVVNPMLRTLEQLSARKWDLHCPHPTEDTSSLGVASTCQRMLTPVPTHESKPLLATSIYAITKKCQEEMCLAVGRSYGIPTVALRYFNVYGSRQALSNPYTGVAAIFSSRLMNRKRPVVFEDGLQSRDFVHVSDIVRANLLVMDRDEANFGVFNVGTGRGLTLLELIAALSGRLNGSVSPDISQKYRAGDIRHCVADIRRIRALGYEPQIPFEEGADELAEWAASQTPIDRFELASEELVKRGLAV